MAPLTSAEHRQWAWGSHQGLSGGYRETPSGRAEAALIGDLATDPTKRDTFDRLHRRLKRLADEVEQAMKSGKQSTR